MVAPVIDATGEQWERVDDAARIVYVRPGTIRVWAKRGIVRSLVSGAHRYVCMTDVRHAEKAWRDRVLATR